MACIPLPKLDLPTLPAPLSLTPPAPPTVSIDANLPFCCKVASLAGSFSIPIPIPPLVLNPAVIAIINAALGAVDAYLDALPLSCPKE